VPIDDAIDRLVRAINAAGLPSIRPAGEVTEVLAEIAAEIHPLRLPDELVTFWRRIDPYSITLTPYAQPTDPAFALECWRSHRDGGLGMPPIVMFPFCYESHLFLFVELEDGHGNGGPCFEWGYCDEAFHLRHTSVSRYLDQLAATIEVDAERLRASKWCSWHDFDPDDLWSPERSAALSNELPLGVYGDQLEFGHDVRNWAPHWLEAQGISAADREPRGATTTIAELLRTAALGTNADGTIHGLVVSAATSGDGCQIRVDDGSATLDLWCPTAVCTYGPIIRTRFEFDVVVQPNPSPIPDTSREHQLVQRLALSGNMLGARAALMDMASKTFGSPKPAEATAIRPLS